MKKVTPLNAKPNNKNRRLFWLRAPGREDPNNHQVTRIISALMFDHYHAGFPPSPAGSVESRQDSKTSRRLNAQTKKTNGSMQMCLRSYTGTWILEEKNNCCGL